MYTAPGTALGRLLRRPAIGSAPSFRGRTPVGDKPPRPEAAALIDRLWDSPELEEEKP